jgi:hypothetical protein
MRVLLEEAEGEVDNLAIIARDVVKGTQTDRAGAILLRAALARQETPDARR